MGAAWLDVTHPDDVEAVLADLRTGEPAEPTTLRAWVRGSRIELYSRDRYDRLADLVAATMQRTGAVRRAVVYLDHDEYGDEHIVMARDAEGLVRRVHHVFAYPYDEDTDEYFVEGEPSMTLVPVASGRARCPGQ